MLHQMDAVSSQLLVVAAWVRCGGHRTVLMSLREEHGSAAEDRKPKEEEGV